MDAPWPPSPPLPRLAPGAQSRPAVDGAVPARARPGGGPVGLRDGLGLHRRRRPAWRIDVGTLRPGLLGEHPGGGRIPGLRRRDAVLRAAVLLGRCAVAPEQSAALVEP